MRKTAHFIGQTPRDRLRKESQRAHPALPRRPKRGTRKECPNHPRNTKSADFPVRDPSLDQDRIANSAPRMRLRRHEINPN